MSSLRKIRVLASTAAPLLALAALSLLSHCEPHKAGEGAPAGAQASSEPSSSSEPARGQGAMLPSASAPEPIWHHDVSRPTTSTWRYSTTEIGMMQVIVSTPPHPDGQRYPVLIALHGRGEAQKGPIRGSRGWIDDYGLYQAIPRLKEPPLTSGDFGGMVEAERLGKLNAALKSKPYEGLIIVCPYTPDLLAGERAFEAAEPFGRFLVEKLLPRVYKDLPAVGTPETTGIDGVSLGGRAALLVGFDHPQVFGAVGALQAAFDAKEIPKLVELAARAKKQNPKLDLRLLTSDADYFLDVNQALSSALGARKVAHTFTLVRGDHSYEFNRGPGVYEMLTHHHLVLHGYPAP